MRFPASPQPYSLNDFWKVMTVSTASVLTWPTFSSHLVGSWKVADQTMAFRFDRSPGWTFKAGQFVDITLLSPMETDAEGNVRGFSLASAPDEDTLLVATRMRDTAFKRFLGVAPPDTEVKIEGPFGDFRLYTATLPAGVMTQPERSHGGWSGETGHLNHAMMKRYLKYVSNPIYYMAGPAPMLKGVREILNAAGIDDDDIRTGEFVGY